MSRKQLNRPANTTDSFGVRPDDADCTFLHVDMDAFYASVELLRRPELVGQPVIVAGGGTRGVVLSATYEARALGVHSAMPVSRARRMCPQGIVLEPHHDDYARVSAGVMAIFRSVTPLVEPLSLDEAFLDVSGARRRLGSPAVIGELIRTRVADEQGITCSVGVASTKFIAKLGSARCKPDGLVVIPPDAVVDFLHPLPVSALWGVGEKTEDVLARLGLRTVSDLAHTPVGTLERALGPSLGRHLAALAWGRDERRIHPDEPDKSIGAEETFAHDIDDPQIIRREFLRLAERTAARLRARGVVGRTVSIKVRFADFTTITRSRTLREPTDTAREVYAVVGQLYEALGLDRARIRLVGVRIEGLAPQSGASRQLALDDRPQGWREAEVAADAASRRFGAGAVRPAALVTDRASGRSSGSPTAPKPPPGPSPGPSPR